jgi:hypothetical protein
MARRTSEADGKRADRKVDGALSPSVEQQINENLKRLYEQASQEPLPDHLLTLLEKLKQEGSAR